MPSLSACCSAVLTTLHRCHRLKRECEPSEPIRKRRAPTSHKPAPKIAQLEGRIDSLVTLLRSVGKSAGASVELRSVLEQNSPEIASQLSGTQNASGTASGRSGPSNEANSGPANDSSQAFSTLHASMATPPTEVSPTNDSPTSTTSLSPPVDNTDIIIEDVSAMSSHPQTELEKETCLELFRTHMLPRCPFTWIPPDTSAASLKHDRPLLYKAICAVTAPSRQERVQKGNHLKRLIAAHMVVENTSSIDLLLALLTFVAWSHEHLHSKAGPSRYMLLAMSIVYDLRLNNPDKPEYWFRKKDEMAQTEDSTNCRREIEERSKGERLERCRAVLGCFILSQW